MRSTLGPALGRNRRAGRRAGCVRGCAVGARGRGGAAAPAPARGAGAPPWAPGRGRSAGSVAASLAPCGSSPSADDRVDREVEEHDDAEQHEGGGIGLVGRVALAGRRVVVDVAGERAAGAAQRAERPGAPSKDCSCRVAPSRITTIAVSPAMRPMPSAVPVAIPGRAAGSRTRRIVAAARLAERIGGLAHVARDRLQRLARGADDERQRDQRHHRPGGQERAAEHRAALGLEREERERSAAENRTRPKIASTMLGRAGDDLDAGLDHPRKPERAPELDQPDRDRDAERQPRSPSRSGSGRRCRSAGRGSRRTSSGRGRRAARSTAGPGAGTAARGSAM